MTELARSLTRLNATAMVAGTIIGASIFVQPSEIARHLDTPLSDHVGWAACGVLTLFGAIVCAELASAFPQTGGVYVFLREAFSPLAGFLWGWAMFWSVHSGIIAAIAMVFARYASRSSACPLRAMRRFVRLAVAVIVALSALNYVGVRGGGRVQTILTVVKVAAIVVLVVAGLLLAGQSRPRRRRVSERARHGSWRVPARDGGGPVRLRRLAHGDLHGRRNEDARDGRFRSALVAGVAIVTVVLRRAEPRVPAGAAARRGPRVDAHRRRRRRRIVRTRRARSCSASGDRFDGWRADRHHPDRTARCTTRWRRTVSRRVRSARMHPRLPDAVARDRGAGVWAACSPPPGRTGSCSRASSTPSGSSSRSWRPDCSCCAARPGYQPAVPDVGLSRSCPLVFIARVARRSWSTSSSPTRCEAADRSRARRARRAGLLSGAMRIVDFHNHYYPPAVRRGAARPRHPRCKVTYDDDGNPCVHYPGDYNILVPGHRDIEYRAAACSTSTASTRRC